MRATQGVALQTTKVGWNRRNSSGSWKKAVIRNPQGVR